MAKKKKGTSSAKRRVALKGFAKGRFQSPVHSNGFKQDVLIDMYGGDKGVVYKFPKPGNAHTAARDANTAGKTYFKFGGATYKVASGPKGVVAGPLSIGERAGKVK